MVFHHFYVSGFYRHKHQDKIGAIHVRELGVILRCQAINMGFDGIDMAV